MEKQKTIYQLWPAKINGIETDVVAVNVLVRNTEDRFTKSRDLPVRFLQFSSTKWFSRNMPRHKRLIFQNACGPLVYNSVMLIQYCTFNLKGTQYHLKSLQILTDTFQTNFQLANAYYILLLTTIHLKALSFVSRITHTLPTFLIFLILTGNFMYENTIVNIQWISNHQTFIFGEWLYPQILSLYFGLV